MMTKLGSNTGGALLGSQDCCIWRGTKTRSARTPIPNEYLNNSRRVHSYQPGSACRSTLSRTHGGKVRALFLRGGSARPRGSVGSSPLEELVVRDTPHPHKDPWPDPPEPLAKSLRNLRSLGS
jgi:hypothetical protein